MICQRIGFPPTSTIGLGRSVVSSESLEPSPPARITAFMPYLRRLRTQEKLVMCEDVKSTGALLDSILRSVCESGRRNAREKNQLDSARHPHRSRGTQIEQQTRDA